MAVTFTRQSPTWADGHTVFAEDAERWEQLGADVAAWSPTVDTGLHQRVMLPGRRYTSPLPYESVTGSIALTAGTAEYAPFPITQQTTFNDITTRVLTAAAGGSVLRCGVYRMDPTTNEPAALVLDAGTTAVDSTGDKVITVNLTLDPGMYYVMMVSNGAPSMKGTSGAMRGYGEAIYGTDNTGLADGFTLTYTGYTATSALPDPATRVGRGTRSSNIPLMWLRRAP